RETLRSTVRGRAVWRARRLRELQMGGSRPSRPDLSEGFDRDRAATRCVLLPGIATAFPRWDEGLQPSGACCTLSGYREWPGRARALPRQASALGMRAGWEAPR